jgi:hypothetical protein
VNMNAICAKSRSQPAVALDQERTVGSYGGAKDRRHDGFRIGLGHGRETDEGASDRRRSDDLGENPGEGVGVSDRQERSDEIERAAGGVSGCQKHERIIGSGADMSPTNAAKWGSRQGSRAGSSARIP